MADSTEPCNFFEEINENRKEKKFTDLILITSDGTKYDVHKIIISTRCPYFKGLFNSNLKESNETEIQLDHNISPINFESILTYIYTGRIEITTENAVEINENAYYFGLTNLKEASEKVLMNDINLENILSRWRWCETFSNNELKSKCLEYIWKYEESFFTQYLLNLKYKEIMEIAANSNLSDEQLYTNLVKWIKNDFEERENYIEDLLKYIDFSALSDDFKINEIQADIISLNSMKFLKYTITSALTKKVMGTVNGRQYKGAADQNKVAIINKSDLVFAFTSQHLLVLKLNTPYPRFVPVIEVNLKQNTVKPIYCNSDKILFCGLEETTDKCKIFSYQSNAFNDSSPMLESRQHFGISKVDDKIYVCGGLNNNGSIEIYDINKDKWVHGTAMSSKQQLFNFKMLNYNQSIYTFGGELTYSTIRNGLITESVITSNVIQRYDPRENIWETVCSDAIKMASINEVFALKTNTIRCFYNNNTRGAVLSICGYDVRKNSIFDLSIQGQIQTSANFYQSGSDVNIFGKVVINNYWQHQFGRLENLLTTEPIKFSEIPRVDLSSLNSNTNFHFLNVGPDQYNYLDTILP